MDYYCGDYCPPPGDYCPPPPDCGGGYGVFPPQQNKVAFTAKLVKTESYQGHSGVLKLTDVLVNEGGGYSSDSSVFTCTKEGFYYFIFHASVYGRAHCAIYKNGDKVVSLFQNTKPEKHENIVSISSVIRLVAKDEVWVNLLGSDGNDIFASDDNDTVFAGFHLGF